METVLQQQVEAMGARDAELAGASQNAKFSLLCI
jgi:hypothetical protein